MVKYLFSLWCCMLFISCSTYQKTDLEKETDSNENYVEYSIKRKGDTVSFVVPKIVFKDTIIYTANKQGTVLKTIYDKNGNVSQIDCYASAFEQMSKIYSKVIQEQLKQQTEVEKNVFTQFIPYLVIAIFIYLLIINLVKK